MLEIKDSVAVITGGSGGIGFALAEYWVSKGGKVVLADIAKEALERAKQQLKGDVITVVCNVTDENDCAMLADTAIEAFGQINLVAPFAGIIMDGLMVAPDRETGKVVKKMSLEAFQKVVDINLTGVFLTVRECSERMINNKCKGLICLISSTGSLLIHKGCHGCDAKSYYSRIFPAGVCRSYPMCCGCTGICGNPHGQEHEPEGPGQDPFGCPHKKAH